jgi:hypothetical protein
LYTLVYDALHYRPFSGSDIIENAEQSAKYCPTSPKGARNARQRLDRGF